MKFRHFLLISALIVLAARGEALELRPSASPTSEPKILAYGPGERLGYEVSYMGIPSGKAVMEVAEKFMMNGREVYHIVSTVESNDFVSIFYPVKDRLETFIDAEDGYSHAIRIRQRQGKKKRNKSIDFDQVRHRAIQHKGNKVETFLIPPMVQDSLSSLYHFRNQVDLEIGASVFIDVHESSKNWELEIQILGREEIKTPLGTFKTVKAKALVRYQGLFMDKGDVTLWLTDDEKHIPVLIKTKIRIGSINATLSSFVPAHQAKLKM